MSAQHTPGPWEPHTDLTVRTASGVILARCASTLGKYEAEAPNVHLMAAAPELLEALIALHAVALVYRDEDYGAVTNAAAAIAKAIGSAA